MRHEVQENPSCNLGDYFYRPNELFLCSSHYIVYVLEDSTVYIRKNQTRNHVHVCQKMVRDHVCATTRKTNSSTNVKF
jgi:hypothetical protein